MEVKQTLTISRTHNITYKEALTTVKNLRIDKNESSDLASQILSEMREQYNIGGTNSQQTEEQTANQDDGSKITETIQQSTKDKKTTSEKNKQEEKPENVQLQQLTEQNNKLTSLLKFCVVGILICLERTKDSDTTSSIQNFKENLILNASSCGINLADVWTSNG
jgi:hypothetical protein